MRLSVAGLRRLVKRPLHVEFNRDLVVEAITRRALPRLTIDVEGTVVRTGATVGWASAGSIPTTTKIPATSWLPSSHRELFLMGRCLHHIENW